MQLSKCIILICKFREYSVQMQYKFRKNKQRDLRFLMQKLVSKANHWLLKNEAKPQFYSFSELKIKSHQNLVLLKLI